MTFACIIRVFCGHRNHPSNTTCASVCNALIHSSKGFLGYIIHIGFQIIIIKTSNDQLIL